MLLGVVGVVGLVGDRDDDDAVAVAVVAVESVVEGAMFNNEEVEEEEDRVPLSCPAIDLLLITAVGLFPPLIGIAWLLVLSSLSLLALSIFIGTRKETKF
jgi:hypothetical protein